MTNDIQQEQWALLKKIMPEAGQLEKKLIPELYGLVRQTIIKEQEQQAEAVNVYSLEDTQLLQQQLERLPYDSPATINQKVSELKLSPEEAEAEVAHWAFNHQALKGELLIKDELLPFKLVRLFEYVYVLICAQKNTLVIELFNQAFGREYGVFSDRALFIDQDHWRGWAWFTNPDELGNQEAITSLSEIWEGMNKS